MTSTGQWAGMGEVPAVAVMAKSIKMMSIGRILLLIYLILSGGMAARSAAAEGVRDREIISISLRVPRRLTDLLRAIEVKVES